MTIRENRLHTIDNKIFTLENVHEIASIFYNEHEKERGISSENLWLNFSAKCVDNSSFESQHLLLFEAGSSLSKKKVESILMEFRKGTEKLIKLKIAHGYITSNDKNVSGSEFEVGGEDNFWVSGIENKILETIESFDYQNNKIANNSKKISWVAFLFGTYLFGMAIDLINIYEREYTPYWQMAIYEDAETTFAFFVCAFFFGGLFFWVFVSNLIEKSFDIWPPTEIQIGPPHKQMERKKRQYYRFLFLSIILPIILSIVANLITILAA